MAKPGRYEPTDVEVDELVKEGEKALLLKVDGDEVWVAKSQIQNMDDFEAYLDGPKNRRGELPTLTVPRWLAVENGWAEEED